MPVSLDADLEAELADVKRIFDSDLSDDELKYWLNIAGSFLWDHLDRGDFDTTKQARMEALAAADAASSQDPRMYREAIGDSDFRYQRHETQTDYYRMLLALDHTGKLPESKSSTSADFETFGPGR